MADGKGVIGQFTEETGEVLKEVANDVKDSVGEVLEQGFQSVAGTQLTPQQIQQKQAEDQKKIAENRKKIAFWQKITEEQRVVRQKKKQEEIQKQQNQQQEKQVAEIKKEEKKKQPVDPAIAYAGKAEFKRGVGG